MFYTIEIYKRKIKCNVDYDTLKQQLDKLSHEDDKFLKNAKMECEHITNGGFVEFNYNIASLLLAFAAFMVSLISIEKIPLTIWTYGVYALAIVGIGALSINMHLRKQNAAKIKFVIDNQ